MASKKRERMQITNVDDVTVVNIGDMEIWDGADLALLRETLTRLIDVDRCKRVGVEMAYVKYIPSGFFGMLYDWHEQGIHISLYSPQPNVARMLWFELFFEHVCGEEFCLVTRKTSRVEEDTLVDSDWDESDDWDHTPLPDSAPNKNEPQPSLFR